MYKDAKYLLNRAIKQSSKSDIDDFLALISMKIEIYKLMHDYSSCVRMLQKLRAKFKG